METDSKEKADELLNQVNEEKADFTSIAEKNSLNSQGRVFHWNGIRIWKNRINLHCTLEENEISGIIEKDGRFYIQKCVNAYDQQATALRKNSCGSEEKQRHFRRFICHIREKYRVHLKGDIWKNIDFSAGKAAASDNFFFRYITAILINNRGILNDKDKGEIF